MGNFVHSMYLFKGKLCFTIGKSAKDRNGNSYWFHKWPKVTWGNHWDSREICLWFRHRWVMMEVMK
jgi:hypothetical protein